MIPQTWIEPLLKSLHDSPLGGHLGLRKTLALVRSRYFFPGMPKIVANYCGSCDICIRTKQRPSSLRLPMKLRQPISSPFSDIVIDSIEFDQASAEGHKYIHVCVDYATRYTVAWSTAVNNSFDIICGFIKHVMSKHGLCSRLYSCLLYTSPSPRDKRQSRMPSSA